MKTCLFSRKSLALIALAAAHLLINTAHATTYYVSICGQNAWAGVNPNCVAPLGPKRSIQAAINVAVDGDTVMVMPGTYFEKIDLDGKEITLISAGGPGTTTIDGNDDGPVVTCDSGETSDTVIQGFSITSGSTSVDGGGMLNVLSSPTVNNCIFSSNHTTGNGAAIACFLAAPTLVDCNIVFNEAGDEPPANNSGMGAGVYAVSSNITLTDCFMQTCYATRRGALMALINSTATIADCDFYTSGTTFNHGEGGGIFLDQSTVTIDNCLFDGVNAWSPDSQGGAIYAINNSQVTCTATTFYSATAQTFGGAASLNDSHASFVGCEFTELGAYQGGAIYVNGGSLSLTLCGLHDNEVFGPIGGGGAIRVQNADVSISLCTFNDNVSGYDGGAISSGGGHLAVGGSTFSGNQARYGGAVRVINGPFDIASCTFSNNVASGGESPEGGAISVSNFAEALSSISDCTVTGSSAELGGGLALVGSNIAVTSCTLENNTATVAGGGAYIQASWWDEVIKLTDCQVLGNVAQTWGGGLYFAGIGHVVVHATQISNNAADMGGGVHVHQNRPTISNCRINYNTADVHGAAVNVSSLYSDLTLVNCVIHNNTAPVGGGAISESGDGWWQGKFRLTNCTVANNNGGGIRIEEPTTESTVTNSILWGNPNGGPFTMTVPEVRYSNVQGGAVGDGNKNATPMFQGALGGNYHLLATSPCIDAGHNWGIPVDVYDVDKDGDVLELLPVDFDGNPRLADDPAAPNAACQTSTAVVDMGAFEVAGNEPPIPVLLGDMNGDGVVNVVDLLAVITEWGPCKGCCPQDFDLDGMIDVNDLLIVIIHWGT